MACANPRSVPVAALLVAAAGCAAGFSSHVYVGKVDEANFELVVRNATQEYVCLYIAKSGEEDEHAGVLDTLRTAADAVEAKLRWRMGAADGMVFAFGWMDGSVLPRWREEHLLFTDSLHHLPEDHAPVLLLYHPYYETYQTGRDHGALHNATLAAAGIGGGGDLMPELRRWLINASHRTSGHVFQGSAGYVFHITPSFLIYPVSGLRTMTGSDAAFFGALVLFLIVLTASCVKGCCVCIRWLDEDDGYNMDYMNYAPPAPQGGHYEHSAVTPPGTPKVRQRNVPAKKEDAE